MDGWPGTVIAGMAFGVSFSTFAIAEWPVRLSGTEKQHKAAIAPGRDRSWLDGR